MQAQNEFYRQALEEVRARRRRNQAMFRLERQAAEADEPRLSEIEQQMAKLGASLAVTALSGEPKKLETMRAELTALASEKQAILEKRHLSAPAAVCQKCGDTGYVKGELCDCVKELAQKRIFAELSKEMPICDCTFDTFDLNFYPDQQDETGGNPRRRMTQILSLCKNYANNFSPQSANLLFLGGTGLGKTHLSLSIASRVLEQGFGVIYGPVQTLLSPIAHDYYRFSGEDSHLQALLDCDLLILDDLGTELSNAFTHSVVYHIINTRLLQKRATIINTNLSLQEIEARYEPRVFSRLIGNYTLKRFIGDDIRQIKALATLGNKMPNDRLSD